MPKTTPSAGKMVIIVGFALSCFGLLLFLWLAFGGPIPLKPKGYQMKASFPDAITLASQADVRVAGVNIGKVVKLERDPQGNRQLATLEIDPEYAPIRQKARMVLRQKTLLGEMYVEVAFGPKDAPKVPEGGELPPGQVASAVEFDELLRALDKETRKAFQDWQASTVKATAGRQQDISDILGNLSRFANSGQDLVSTLNQRRAALQSLVRDTGTTFDALNRDTGALQRLIRSSDTALTSLATHRAALAESIRIFPTFLEETRRTVVRTEEFGRDTRPLIRDLDPVLEDLPPTLRSLRDLSPDLQRLFNDLPELVNAGRSGLPALSRFLRGLDPTLASIGPFLQNINPVVEFLELYQGIVTNFLSIGASATALKLAPPPNQNQTNGHALPQNVVFGTQSFPAENRSPDNRGNAYFPPDGLSFTEKAARHLIPPNWDCSHVGGEKLPQTSPLPGESSPGCFVAPDVTFEGRTSHFPQVRRAAPGGLTNRPAGAG